jgi:polyhydroxyalkanoate synthase subunit PhaC
MVEQKLPISSLMKNFAEEADSIQQRFNRSKDVLLGDLESEIAVTPCDIVYQQDRVRLKHYKAVTEKKVQTPLLIVYALVNRETLLDLQPGRSVVENFLKQGIDVYMIDWGYPTRKDRYQGIDDHVNIYMDDIVDFIRERSGFEKINVMGICMGGTFSVIYAALHPEKIQNVITTVSPTTFDIDTGLLNVWIREMPVDQLTDTYGNIPGDLLNLGFLLLNPARLMVDKYKGLLDGIDDKVFVENFVRMEKWIFDSPDIPGETFREFLKDCFQENLLIQNRMVVGGKLVDLQNVSMPLLNIYAKFDHLVPPEACEQLTSRVGSDDTEDICLKTGHVGVYVSSKCQKDFAPKIFKWLKERDVQPSTEQIQKRACAV